MLEGRCFCVFARTTKKLVAGARPQNLVSGPGPSARNDVLADRSEDRKLVDTSSEFQGCLQNLVTLLFLVSLEVFWVIHIICGFKEVDYCLGWGYTSVSVEFEDLLGFWQRGVDLLFQLVEGNPA